MSWKIIAKVNENDLNLRYDSGLRFKDPPTEEFWAEVRDFFNHPDLLRRDRKKALKPYTIDQIKRHISFVTLIDGYEDENNYGKIEGTKYLYCVLHQEPSTTSPDKSSE